jgi:hypothetical protein
VAELRPADPHLAQLNSLDHAFQTLINSDDGMKIGRTAARQMWGNGWKEARSSVVLAEAVSRWLGPDHVEILAFWNDDGQQHAIAVVGQYALSDEGVTSVDHILLEFCRRYRTSSRAARLAPLDVEASGLNFTMGDSVAEQSIAHLTTLLTKAIDPSIAMMVLQPGS